MEGLLAYVGYRAYQGKIGFFLALFAIILGGIVATVLGYGIVRAIGVAVTKKHIRHFYPDSDAKEYLVSSFKRVGKWGLVFGYFLPVIRHMLGPLAAILAFELFDFIVLVEGGSYLTKDGPMRSSVQPQQHLVWNHPVCKLSHHGGGHVHAPILRTTRPRLLRDGPFYWL